jgi:dimethylpropiothetin dethiomethylase
MTDLPHLSQRPAWTYLLRDFLEMYRRLPAGGSDPIRAHQRTVRECIGRLLRDDPMVMDRTGTDRPVTTHLQRALDQGREGAMASIIRTLDGLRGHLAWEYGYDKLPKGLDQRYAYAELVGPNGPVVSQDIILGLVLFAPACVYPTHAHDGIFESYICLSGAMSQNDQGVYVPGSMIFNPPGNLHRITVADHEPSLLAYAWVGPREKLLTQKMVFSRAPRPRSAAVPK